jgi:HK97 family phage major capsid protein/ATP-dependent Clp endopeptidase proteolytic subunit ClpP
VGVVYLYDEVLPGMDADLVRELQALAGVQSYEMHLNSPGGEVFTGWSIYNILHPLNPVVYVDGLAASIASIIMLCGDDRRLHPLSEIMVHQPHTGGAGLTAEDMREQAKLLDKITDQMISIYRERTGMRVDRLEKLLSTETYLTAEEAATLGFGEVYDFQNSVPIDKSPILAKMQALQIERQGRALRPSSEKIRSEEKRMDRKLIEASLIKRGMDASKVAAMSEAELLAALDKPVEMGADKIADIAVRAVESVMEARAKADSERAAKAAIADHQIGATPVMRFASTRAQKEGEDRAIEARMIEGGGKERPGNIAALYIMGQISAHHHGLRSPVEGLAAVGRGKAAQQIEALVAPDQLGTGGNYCPPQIQTNFIAALEPMTMVEARIPAANKIQSNKDSVKIPVDTGGVSVAAVARNSAPTATDPTDGFLTLTARQMGGCIVLMKDWILEASITAPEVFLRNKLAARMAQLSDAWILCGSGQSGQPEGIFTTLRLNSRSTAATTTPDYSDVMTDLVKLEQALDLADAGGQREQFGYLGFKHGLQNKKTAIDEYPFRSELDAGNLGGYPVHWLNNTRNLSGLSITEFARVSLADMYMLDKLGLYFEVSNQAPAGTALDPLRQYAIYCWRQFDSKLARPACGYMLTAVPWATL